MDLLYLSCVTRIPSPIRPSAISIFTYIRPSFAPLELRHRCVHGLLIPFPDGCAERHEAGCRSLVSVLKSCLLETYRRLKDIA